MMDKNWLLLTLIACQIVNTYSQTELSCNFDSGGCYFTGYDATTNWGWKRTSGSTTTGNTGPTSDHTSGSGYYMYTEPQNCNAGTYLMNLDVTAAVGTSFHDWGVSFYYNMYGNTMGTITLQT
jgi:hypothetical protein